MPAGNISGTIEATGSTQPAVSRDHFCSAEFTPSDGATADDRSMAEDRTVLGVVRVDPNERNKSRFL